MRVVEMPGLQSVGGQQGLDGSVQSCGGRKDDMRQQITRTDHTEPRKPVNLGNAHPRGVQDASLHDTTCACKMLEGRRRHCGQHRAKYTLPSPLSCGGGVYSTTVAFKFFLFYL